MEIQIKTSGAMPSEPSPGRVGGVTSTWLLATITQIGRRTTGQATNLNRI